MWKKLDISEKIKYKEYTKLINEEREKLRDIYELINGIRPKKSAGAFRIFAQEQTKKNLCDMKNIKELWKKLREDEKREYLRKSHKCILAYRYKKMIYNKKIKRLLPKKPSNGLFYFLKEKKGQPILNGGNKRLYRTNVFNELPNSEKNKYINIAKKEREKYIRKKNEFKNAIFDFPKRPKTAFSAYIEDNINKLKGNQFNIDDNIKIISDNWLKEDIQTVQKYMQHAKIDRIRFGYELKQFKKLGYYIKYNQNDTMEDSYRDNKTIKKKRTERNYSKIGQKKKPKTPLKKNRITSPKEKKTLKGKTQLVNKNK